MKLSFKISRRLRNKVKFFAPIVVILIALTILFFHFKPLSTWQNITSYQFYDLVIKVIAAFLTLSAIIVALFKESFVSVFNFVDLKIINRDKDFIREILNPAYHNTLAALSYETVLKVTNNGNILAEGCVIKVAEINFKKDSTGIDNTVEVFDSIPLKWNDGSSETDIHPENSASVSVIVLSSETTTVPGTDRGQNAKLIIGGIQIKKEHTNGKFEVVFELLCKNHRVIKYKMIIAWDGTWKSRASEIKGSYSISPDIQNKVKKSKKQ